MELFSGKGVYGAVTMGKLYFYEKDTGTVNRKTIEDTKVEIARMNNAKEQARDELSALYEKALKEVGEVNAQIFEIHQMMLEDDDYCSSIINIISSQRVNAEYAVLKTSDTFSQMFSSMDDDYMKARAADVIDISNRIIRCLIGSAGSKIESDEPVILVASDLTPSETVQLDKNKILAFVTFKGSENSHTAILARTMAIPAVVSVGEISSDYNGLTAIVNGFDGTICIEPDEKAIEQFKMKQALENEKIRLRQELKGKSNTTLDGKMINLFANISGLSDIGTVLQNDAGGIGLFRSEFLYLQNDHFPTEEEQFNAYREVAEKMGGKKVIIRTMDIGADKKIGYFNLPEEENPALGYRAIRICLKKTDLFKTQLRAIFRAAVFGNISIMFPMIISLDEVLEIKQIITEIKEELKSEGVPFNENVEIGIMIETPAAAIMSDILAKEVDFFSIGTNDLTQYTLAIDRQNESLEKFYNPHHEAILRLIEMVVKNAHGAGIWAGICGELGADISLTERFLRMGIDELSVSPSKILPIREKIRSVNLKA